MRPNANVDLIDIIISALLNTFECSIDTLRENEDKQEYYLSGNMYHILPGRKQCICKYELKFLKIADHYDALVKYDYTEDICDFNIKEPTVPHENLSSSKKHIEMVLCRQCKR